MSLGAEGFPLGVEWGQCCAGMRASPLYPTGMRWFQFVVVQGLCPLGLRALLVTGLIPRGTEGSIGLLSGRKLHEYWEKGELDADRLLGRSLDCPLLPYVICGSSILGDA